MKNICYNLLKSTNMEDNVKDITVEILKSIRDEIRLLREDTNQRFEEMNQRFGAIDNRFERIEADISDIRKNMKSLLVRFDRDYTLLATDVDGLRKRIMKCEKKLKLKAC